jgi:hypothetical protein
LGAANTARISVASAPWLIVSASPFSNGEVFAADAFIVTNVKLYELAHRSCQQCVFVGVQGSVSKILNPIDQVLIEAK